MHGTASRLVVAATTAAATVVVSAGAASAATGDLDVFLADPQDREPALVQTDVGNLFEGDVALVCDIIEGAEGADVTVFQGGSWRVPGADGEVSFGRPGDVPLCGDWGFVEDGEAQDTFAVRRGNRYFLSLEPADFAGGRSVASFVFGRATDQALVGDWDGDGVDTIALRRGNTIYFATDNVDGGGGVRTSSYGRASDLAVAGDFTDEGRDVVAVRRGNVFFVSRGEPGGRLRNDFGYEYGRSSDIPLAGTPFRGQGDYVGLVRVEG